MFYIRTITTALYKIKPCKIRPIQILQIKTMDLTTNKKRILVVDDDAPSRLILDHFLKHEEFYIVDLRKNGRDALDFINNYEIDLLISDIEMEDLDGIELCQSLFNDEKTSRIPVILQTIRDKDDTRRQTRQFDNVKKIIQKPYSRQQLLSDIEELLSD